MSYLLKSSLIALALAISPALTSCATPVKSSSAKQKVISAPLTLDLKAGQILQVAMLSEKRTAAAQAVRDRYFQTAIPHAASLGDKYLGNLRVKSTLIGEQTPRAFALWVFPDKESQDTFRASPKWPDYVQMRREGWEELNVYSATVESDTLITFEPDKDYTFAAAWTRPESGNNYSRYLDGIEADFDKIGARYLARFNKVDLQSTGDNVENPSHLTLVEWSDGPDLKGLRETKAYQANSERFSSVVSRFDLYWADYPTPG